MMSSWKFSNLHYCSICCKHHVDPRILPCGHTYCLACLASQNAGDTQSISLMVCPECPAQFPLPEDGIANLPKNIFVATLANPLLSSNSDVCGVHVNRKRDKYCQRCNEALCDLCVTGGHVGHPCQPLGYVADKLRQRLSAVAMNIDAEIAKCQSFVNLIKDNQARFASNQEELRHRVVDEAKSVEMTIEQHRIDLVEKIDACKRRQNESVRLVRSRAEELRENLEKVLVEVDNNARCFNDIELARNFADVKALVDTTAVSSNAVSYAASQLCLVKLHLIPNDRYTATCSTPAGGSCCLIGTIEAASADDDDKAAGDGKSETCSSSMSEQDVSSLVETSPGLYIPEPPAPNPIYIPDPPSPDAHVERSSQPAYGRATSQQLTGIYSQTCSSPSTPFESFPPDGAAGRRDNLSSVCYGSSTSSRHFVCCSTFKSDKSCRGRGRNVSRDVQLPPSAFSNDARLTSSDSCTERAENFNCVWTDSDMSTETTHGSASNEVPSPRRTVEDHRTPPLYYFPDPPSTMDVKSAKACGISRSSNSPTRETADVSVSAPAITPLFSSSPGSTGLSGYRVRDGNQQQPSLQTVDRSFRVCYRGRLQSSTKQFVVPCFEDKVGSASRGACEAVAVSDGRPVQNVIGILPSGGSVRATARRLGTVSSNDEDISRKRMQFDHQPISPKGDVKPAVETSLFQYFAPPPSDSFQMCAPELPRGADLVPANSYQSDVFGNLDRNRIDAGDGLGLQLEIASRQPLSVQSLAASKSDDVDFQQLTDSPASPPERSLPAIRTFHRMMVANRLPPLQEVDDPASNGCPCNVVTSLTNNMASGNQLIGDVGADEFSHVLFQTGHVQNESVDTITGGGGGGDGPKQIERELALGLTADLSSLNAEICPPGGGLQTRVTSRRATTTATATTLSYFPSAENDNSSSTFAADCPRRAQRVDNAQQTAADERKCDSRSVDSAAGDSTFRRLASCDDVNRPVKSGQLSTNDQLPIAEDLLSDDDGLNGETKNTTFDDVSSSAASRVTRVCCKRSGRRYFPELSDADDDDEVHVSGGRAAGDLRAQSAAGACLSEKTDVLHSSTIATDLLSEHSTVSVQHHRYLTPQGEEIRGLSPNRPTSRPSAATAESSARDISPEKRAAALPSDRDKSPTASCCAAVMGQDSPPRRQREVTSGFAANVLRRILHCSKSPDVQQFVPSAAKTPCGGPGETEIVLMAETMSAVSHGRSEIADEPGVSQDRTVDNPEVDLSEISGVAVVTECTFSADVVSSNDPVFQSTTSFIAATARSETGIDVAACIPSMQPDTSSHRKRSSTEEDVKKADSAIISLVLFEDDLENAQQTPSTSAASVSSSGMLTTATGSPSRRTDEQMRVEACDVVALQPVPDSSVGSPLRKSHQVKQSSSANVRCESSRDSTRGISAKSVSGAMGVSKSDGFVSQNMAKRRGGDKDGSGNVKCNKNVSISSERQVGQAECHRGRSQLQRQRQPYRKEDRGGPRKYDEHDSDRVVWSKMKSFGESKTPQFSADSGIVRSSPSRGRSSSSGVAKTTANVVASSTSAGGSLRTVPDAVHDIGRDAANGQTAASQTQYNESRKQAQPRSSYGKQNVDFRRY